MSASAPHRAAPGLRVEVHVDRNAFDRLEPEWRALSAAASNACAFLGVDWHRTWWDVYARRGDALHLVALRLDGALVGLLPLYRRRIGTSGVASLQFVGTGEPRGEEVVTEYADALARDDVADLVGDAALEHLLGFARWRRVELRCVLEGAVLMRSLRRRRPGHVRVRPAGLRYRIDLAAGEAAHLARLSDGRARRIGRSRRAALRDGGLEHVPLAGGAGLDAAFATLARLHADRQRRLGRRGAFAAERFARFHRTLAGALLARGDVPPTVDVAAWRIRGEPVSALHLYGQGDTLHYYQSGFAARGANRWMPLTLAHLDRMRLARDEGYRWYDLMRGEPPCYKDDFGCETTPLSNVLLFASGADRQVEDMRRAARSRLADALARLGLRRR